MKGFFNHGRRTKITAVRRMTLAALPLLLIAAAGSSTAQAAMYSSQDLRWPNNRVYYALDSSLPDAYKVAVQRAAAHFNAHQSRTGVWIFARTYQADYVRILPTSSGPSRVSYVGYQGGVQYMYLNQNVPPIWQVVAHEFGHVLGLHHEHQRCERDIWLNVPEPGGPMLKQCGLPTAERYNPMSIMHYSDSELRDLGGASLKLPGYSAPAKSLHPGLVESDLRTINTMYRSSGAFSMVSVMHGKCLTAADLANGARVRMHECKPERADQDWSYDAQSGEFKVGAKCLGVLMAQREAPLVIGDCTGSQQQKWDFGTHGGLLMRSIKDPEGRPLCAEVMHWLRDEGTELMVQYCHRGDNQQWRRHPVNWRVGLGTVTFVSDVIPANVSERQPSKCMDVASADTATPVLLADCGDQHSATQRFVRTLSREIRIHGKCLDGHNGQAGDPVRLWDCNSAPNQRWEITGTGTLYGINGLCIEVTGGSSANGTPLRLATCTPGAAIRWWTRDPR